MRYKSLWKEYIDSIENSDLLQEALTHSSKSREDSSFSNNERLEFLGDAVLKLTITRYLFDNFTKKQEGTLTKYRAKLISDKMLASLAKKLNLIDRVNIGSTLSRVNMPDSVIGDAVEALIGAIYLDSGLERASEFILKLWQEDMKQAILDSHELEYKSRLQELIQEKYKKLPEYRVISCGGPDHKKEFEIGVYLDDKLLAQASAFSKKEASQSAAKFALENKDEWLI
jgi:ribonuclease III